MLFTGVYTDELCRVYTIECQDLQVSPRVNRL